MTLRAMISQPMAGKSKEEILSTRSKAVATLEAMGYDVVNTYFNDEWVEQQDMQERGIENIPVYFLARSLERMASCHAVYFCIGWENTRGCRAEHKIAKDYGLKIIYEGQLEAEHETQENKRYATTYWTAEDLIGEQADNILGKKLSREEAENFLESMEGRLRESMIEVGWNFIELETMEYE